MANPANGHIAIQVEDFNLKPDNIYHKFLLEPYNYISCLRSKKIREKIGIAFNHWLCVPQTQFRRVSETTTMLHNASLMLDDIEDSSEKRRGAVSTHKRFGVAQTINSANFVSVLALEKVLEMNNKKAAELFKKYTRQMLTGQGMEIYWRDHFHCPTEYEYETIVVKKTSGLFNLMVRLLQLFTLKKYQNFKNLIHLLAFYFQIRDDHANLMSPEYSEQKGFCEDVTEGKFSFPMIHALSHGSDDDRSRLLEILKMRSKDDVHKREVVSLMSKYGSLKYTEQKLGQLKKKIENEIKRLGGNPVLEQVFKDHFVAKPSLISRVFSRTRLHEIRRRFSARLLRRNST